MPQVAPYSGDMLAMVARSASGKIAQAGAEVLDKFPDDAVLAQHLSNGQNKIGGGRAFAQASSKLHADDQRNQHGNRLPQHRSLGLDAAHAPSQHA